MNHTVFTAQKYYNIEDQERSDIRVASFLDSMVKGKKTEETDGEKTEETDGEKPKEAQRRERPRACVSVKLVFQNCKKNLKQYFKKIDISKLWMNVCSL